MANSIVFMLGCWLGCIGGFLLAGLMSRSRTDDVSGGYPVGLHESERFPATPLSK